MDNFDHQDKMVRERIAKQVDIDEEPVCPKCGTAWYPDCDDFGCWVCGYEKEDNIKSDKEK